MTELAFRNFRGWGRNAIATIPLSPLTLLIGRPDTGKSALLAAIAAAQDLACGRKPDFRRPPWFFSATTDMRAPTLIRLQSGGPAGIDCTVEATFASDPDDVPIPLTEYIARDARGMVVIRCDADGNYSSFWQDDDRSFPLLTAPYLNNLTALHHAVAAIEFGGRLPDADEAARLAGAVIEERVLNRNNDVRVIAAHRAAAMRLYNPTQPVHDPFGTHVAMRLRALPATGDLAIANDAITRFGLDSGLWEAFNIRRFGRKRGDPFAVEITPTGDRPRNLADVGLSTAQAFSFVADIATVPPGALLLAEHPDGHMDGISRRAFGRFIAREALRGVRFVAEVSDEVARAVGEQMSTGTVSEPDCLILRCSRAGEDGFIATPVTLDAI